MIEQRFGEVIRKMRREMGWTQEDLSYGICATSTLSKIENGSQVPKQRTFRLLTERLGAPGLFYTQFFTEMEYQFELAKRGFWDAVERGDLEGVDQKLWEMKRYLIDGQENMMQTYEMAKRIWFHLCGMDRMCYARDCFQIFQMRRPKCLKLDELVGTPLDEVEMWIVNNIAVGLLWQGKAEKALPLFGEIYHRMRGMPVGTMNLWKAKGVLCNNMALCYLQMHSLDKAQQFCDYGMETIIHEGGFILHMQLMMLQMEIMKQRGKSDTYYEQTQLLQKITGLLAQVGIAGENFIDYLCKNKEMLIL